MYACDYDDLGPMGTRPIFEPAPSKVETEHINRIIASCHERLCDDEDNKDVGDKEAMAFVMQMWIFRFDECATELRGVSVSDLLFTARSNLLCCALPKIRDRAVFNDIHELYVRVQLLGTNHTRARFTQQDSARDVEELEHRCASLIVYELGESPEDLLQRLGDEPLPRIDALLAARLNPLRNVPDIIQPTEEEIKEEAKRKAVDKARLRKENPDVSFDDDDENEERKDGLEMAYDQNEGNYWHSDKDTVIRGFIRMASRVFRNYWLQRTIFEKYPIRASSKCPEYSDNVKQQFTKWLQVQTKCDYANDSVKKYRDLVYEHWMPDGSRQEMLRYFRTKYDIMQPLNLLENQLGVVSATSLANMARVSVKEVAMNVESETYDFLLLSQFGELMRFDTDAKFFEDYYIGPGELGGMKRRRLDCKNTWGRPRRPILVRIMRAWYIHDAGEWIICTNKIDALLNMMTLWRTTYGSCFAHSDNKSKLEAWIKRVTEPTNEEDYIEGGGVDSDDD
jgi:hypothetical protein